MTTLQRVWSQFIGPFGHNLDHLGKQTGIRSPDVKHLQTLPPDTDLIKEGLGIGNPFFCPKISFQEMAVADLSPTHKHGISPGLKRLQDMDNLHLAGTQVLDDAHRGRIL